MAQPRKSVTLSLGSNLGDRAGQIEKAVELLEKEGKGLLLNFTGSDWCGWCHKLEGEVFAKPEFKAYAAKHWVLVYLDFPQDKPVRDAAQNEKLQQRFGVEGYPTIVLLDGDEAQIGETGYEEGGAAKYVEHLEAFRVEAAELKAKIAALEQQVGNRAILVEAREQLTLSLALNETIHKPLATLALQESSTGDS